MKDKEIAYIMYHMKCGENITLKECNIEVRRVPGGWIYDGVFVPFNYEFHAYSVQPTNIKVRLRCPKCLKEVETYVKEKFQGNEYEHSCGGIITYKHKWEDENEV